MQVRTSRLGTRILHLQPRLPVASLRTAYAFYRDVLGFSCTQPAEPVESDGFVILQRDGFALQLAVVDATQAVSRATVWIHVEDAAAEFEQVKGRAIVEWGPEVYWYGSREFGIRDPDGHGIIFSSPSHEAPTCAREPE